MNENEAHELFARLLRRIAPEVDLATVDAEAPLQEEIDLDSMDFLNLVTAVHDATGIEIPERDYPLVSSVSRFVDYIAAAPSPRR